MVHTPTYTCILITNRYLFLSVHLLHLKFQRSMFFLRLLFHNLYFFLIISTLNILYHCLWSFSRSRWLNHLRPLFSLPVIVCYTLILLLISLFFLCPSWNSSTPVDVVHLYHIHLPFGPRKPHYHAHFTTESPPYAFHICICDCLEMFYPTTLSSDMLFTLLNPINNFYFSDFWIPETVINGPRYL